MDIDITMIAAISLIVNILVTIPGADEKIELFPLGKAAATAPYFSCSHVGEDEETGSANSDCTSGITTLESNTDCTSDPTYLGLTTLQLVGVIAGAVIGFIVLVVILAWICISIKSACNRRRKRRQEQRAIRYYRRNPTTSVCRDSTYIPSTEPDSPGTSGKPPERVIHDYTMNLKVRGGELPISNSISADVEQQALVVDMATGRQTIKKSNLNRPDNASTRSLQSFKMDAVSQDMEPSDDDKVSLISANDNRWNLDSNMADKHVDKSMAKAIGNISDTSDAEN